MVECEADQGIVRPFGSAQGRILSSVEGFDQLTMPVGMHVSQLPERNSFLSFFPSPKTQFSFLRYEERFSEPKHERLMEMRGM